MKQLKLITKLRGLIVLALALVFSGNAWADTVTKSVTLHPTGVATNGTSNASNTSYAYYASTNTSSFATITCSSSTGDGYIYYTFDNPNLPTGATITSVSCVVGIYADSSGKLSSSTQLYNSTTAVGNSASITNGTSAGNTVTIAASDPNVWTTDNIENLVLRINASCSGSTARTVHVGGADLIITYSYEEGPAAPVFSPASCDFTGSIDVTLSSATEGASIYYTQDGTTPSASNGTLYSGAITLTASNTILAVAIKDGESSTVVNATYTKVTPNAITSFTAASTSIKVGATTTATLVKASSYTGNVTYSVTNNGAATVTQEGDVFTIVGVANGTVVIEAVSAAQDGYTANTARVTVTVTTSHKPTNYSTSWTTSNEIYLYNKATGLYLGSGGHWGTEGILKTTGLPFYMNAGASEKSDATGVGMFSDSGKTTAHRVGYQSSAQVFGIENQGIYIDAGTNYPTQTFSFYYNSDDDSYSIVPDAMVTGIEISGTNDEGKTVYLTPSSATTLSWTTTPYYWSLNSSNQIYTVSGTTASGLGTKYYLYAYGTTLSLTTSASTASVSKGKLTIGGYYLTGNTTTLTTTSDDTNANAVIYEQGTSSKFYLTKNGGTSVARQNVVTVRQYSTTDIPDEARWFVVTKANLIADFENATATDAAPKEATFLLLNSDFSREVDQAWTFEQPTGTSYTSQTDSYGSNGYIRIGNSLFQNSGPNHTINDQYTSVEEAGVALGSGTYKGNGNNYVLVSPDDEYANLPVGTSTYYNIPYGGFYNCRILGNSGKVYQQVTITKAGYYRVSCDGYVYNPSGATGTATFYAKNSAVSEKGKQYVTATLPAAKEFETMTDAGITFYANGGTSPYHNSILVYMPAGTMEIGVILAGGTIGTVKNSNTNTFAEFDAMKIEYTGNVTYDIILNEALTSENIYKDTDKETETDINYINAQVYNVTGKTARTMYLRRSMKTDQWNTIVLPVNISNSAFNTAFGSDAILTKFDHCSGNWIFFTSVDHSDETSTTPAMEAGKCYLIKPYSISAATEGTYSTDYANASGSISVEASSDVPVFQFNQISLTEEIEEDPTYDGRFRPTTDTEVNNYLAFMGTYFQNDNAIGQYSYAIDSSDGSWKRWIGTKSLACKGFRCWIGQKTSDPINNQGAKMFLVVDGEEVDPTDIADVTIKESTSIKDNRVYSVSGQLVGNSDNMNNLPKGIYISNGKKFIVK